MSIELVGLAYDRGVADTMWSGVAVKEAFDIVLEDDFRRKVDLRSMLYHTGHLELQANLEGFLKQGGEKLSVVELIAERFRAGVEDFPISAGELGFDFQLIRHFSSLAMADDFLVADPFLREILRKVGFLKNGSGWSLLEARDFEGVASALGDVRIQDILEVGKGVPAEPTTSFEHLVRNYIEFLSYARNNRLTPFFYNTQSDSRKWGDLVERKNQRNEKVVDLSMRGSALRARRARTVRSARKETTDLKTKLRLKRECDSLLWGLRDTDPLIRQKAAESLGLLSDREALPALIQALRDEEPQVRQEIARAIGAVHDPRSAEALLGVVAHDEAVAVRLTAAHLLRLQAVQELIPLLLKGIEEGVPHFSALLAHHPGLPDDPAAHEQIARFAKSDQAALRREAAFLLGRIPGSLARDALTQLAVDEDAETQVNALYALWERDPKESSSLARKLASSRTESVARAGTIVAYWGDHPRPV